MVAIRLISGMIAPLIGGPSVQHVAEYLKNAGDCLTRAVNAKSLPVRAQLIEVAKQWSALAAEREQFVRTKALAESRRPH